MQVVAQRKKKKNETFRGFEKKRETKLNFPKLKRDVFKKKLKVFGKIEKRKKKKKAPK